MNIKENVIRDIFRVSLSLFAENGYAGTSIRHIAAQANISVGLTHHYFGNKERLGRLALTLLSDYVCDAVDARIDFESDPILNDLTATRCRMQYMYHGPYRQFYLDSLRVDLFFNALLSNEALLLNELQKQYGFESTPDNNLLYNNYIPYNVEKTLILKKEEGLFPTIEYSEIPWHICYASMGRFLPEALLREKDTAARAIASEIQKSISSTPSDEVIDQYLMRLMGELSVKKDRDA